MLLAAIEPSLIEDLRKQLKLKAESVPIGEFVAGSGMEIVRIDGSRRI